MRQGNRHPGKLLEEGDTHLADATYCVSNAGTETTGCTFDVALANSVCGFGYGALNALWQF